MSIAKIYPLVETLSRSETFQLIQLLLSQLAEEEDVTLQVEDDSDDIRDEHMVAFSQRVADRNAQSHITDPTAWQREIFKDRPMPRRE